MFHIRILALILALVVLPAPAAWTAAPPGTPSAAGESKDEGDSDSRNPDQESKPASSEEDRGPKKKKYPQIQIEVRGD
jgi:hypothetical protein